MTSPVERLVDNGAVRLAVTDLGGDGPPLVLMHGLGTTRKTLEKVAARLRGWRVVTMDLRGHGGSTSGPWDFEAACADLEAVVRALGIERPWVGGHSLGGMVALRYAISGRPVAGAVNIDGWGPGVASRFPGEDEAFVTRQLARFGEGLPPVARALTCWTRQAREGTHAEVLRLLHGADVVAWHRDAPCPSLAFNAVAPGSRVHGWLLGRDMARLQLAHRRGLQRDLEALAQADPGVHVAEVDATHYLVSTHPDVVASAIDSFRDRVDA